MGPAAQLMPRIFSQRHKGSKLLFALLLLQKSLTWHAIHDRACQQSKGLAHLADAAESVHGSSAKSARSFQRNVSTTVACSVKYSEHAFHGRLSCGDQCTPQQL